MQSNENRMSLCGHQTSTPDYKKKKKFSKLFKVLLIYILIQPFENTIKTKEDCHNLRSSENNDEANENEYENNTLNLYSLC